MTNNNEQMIPYILYESEMMRVERRHKRNFWLVMALIFALLISNMAWLWAWTQYDYAGEEILVDAGDRGIASYIGRDGDINYGEGSSEAKDAY